MPLTFSNSARLKVGAHLRQQFANALSKDLVNDAAGSSVDAPDSSSLASNMIEKNDAISEYSQPIKTVKFSFERSDVSFFFLQSLQAAPQRLARLRRQRTNEIDDLLLQFNLDQAHRKYFPLPSRARRRAFIASGSAIISRVSTMASIR